jgi:hypothetical protein
MQILADGARDSRQSPQLKEIFEHQESQYDNRVWKEMKKKRKLKD